MPYCSGCGNEVKLDAKFCSECGKKVKVEQEEPEVLETDEPVVEMKPITEPEQIESDGSRIGGRDGGEWLEKTVESIFKNANFQTKTQENVPIMGEDSKSFKIDVLADDGKHVVFVECKDYVEPQQKSLWEFIGQLKTFRERQNRRVIGVLAVSKRNDDRFKDWRKKLEQDDSVLFDGSIIESFQTKRAELGNNADFYNYLANFLNIEVKKSNQEDNAVKYRVRFNFRTIEPREYIGGKYDPLIILSDIEKKLPSHIKRAHYQQDKNSPQIFADYFFNYDDPNIAKQEKKGFLARLLSNDSYDKLLEKDLERVKEIIKKTYGISKDKQNKIEHTVAREGRD
ncbi:MAG: zinc ribbon domain-containing protein [Nitrosopumilaceae archaeon]